MIYGKRKKEISFGDWGKMPNKALNYLQISGFASPACLWSLVLVSTFGIINKRCDADLGLTTVVLKWKISTGLHVIMVFS